jgi:hypothetical protein
MQLQLRRVDDDPAIHSMPVALLILAIMTLTTDAVSAGPLKLDGQNNLAQERTVGQNG